MPIEFVVNQHWEAALGLALRRAVAVREWHYSLCDILGLDDQLVTHQQALLGNDVLSSNLANEAPSEYDVVFLITLLNAAAKSDVNCLDLACRVCTTVSHRTAFSDALSWHEWDIAAPIVDGLLDTGDSDLQLIGLRASRLHGQRLSSGIVEVFKKDAPELPGEVARLVSDLAGPDFLVLASLLTDNLDRPAGPAISEAILLRHRASELKSHRKAAVECLTNSVLQNPSDTASGARMLMCVLEVGDARELLRQLGGGNQASVRVAIQCAGWLGIPDSIPWLIQMMSQPLFARVAGESFYRITGLRLDQRPYEGDWPDGFEAGPNDDPEDENVEMDEDENLPWPEPGPIAEWWEQNPSRFKSNVRYLLGFELDNEEWLRKVLVLGRQRERATAALELAIRNPTEPLFNVEEHGRRQMKKLGIKRLPNEEYRCNHIEAGPDDHTWKKYLRKKK